MTISVVFDPPLPSDNPADFNTKAFALLGDLNTWSTQANALPGEVATNLSALLAAPPAIGSTTPAAGSFTTLSASGLATLGQAQIPGGVFIGSDTDVFLYESVSNALTVRVGTSGAYKYNTFLADGGVNFNNGKLAIDSAGAVTIPGGLAVTGSTLGYGTGAGGTVTQATSKYTAVTLHKACGQITMNNAALAAGATETFYLYTSYLSGTDVLLVQGIHDGVVNPANYAISCIQVYGPTHRALISVKNISAGSLSDSVVIQFAVLKGATS